MATATRTTSRTRTAPRTAPRDSTATKRRILDASERVVLRDGVGHLTLEAAATEAGLSKGGVLYHFPTRDSLVAAMVTRIIEQFDGDIASYLPEPGRRRPACPAPTPVPTCGPPWSR